MTPTAVESARPEVVTEAVPRRRQAWIERATSTDHKSVGMLYIGAALAFGVAALAELVVMRVQLIVPGNTMTDPEIFNRILSTFAVTGVVLFAIPLALGLISYVSPLQVGARGVAFPRLNLLSFWLFVSGGFTIFGSFLWRPSEAGFAAMPPLSEPLYSNTHGVDSWIVGTALALLGFVCFAVNLVVTLRNMRAPGMAWRRVPLFTWAANLGGYLLLVCGSVMLAALVMLFIDRNFGGVFFDPGYDGAPILYEHLAWFFFTGAFTFIFVFAAGVISDVLPAFARKPLFSHRGAMACLLAVAIVGPLAWMRNMYTAPIPTAFLVFAMLCAVALTVPIGLLIYNWIATVWGGTLRTRAAPLYALAAISAMTIGLAGDLAWSLIPVGWQIQHTTAAQGATIMVIVGGAVLGGFAALHYWFPKVTGRLLGEGLGKVALVAILVGLYVFAAMSFLSGVKGQPVDIYKFFAGEGLDGYNLVASIGAFVMVVGVLLEFGNAAHSWGKGVATGHDPWAAGTLEWFTTSPPPVHNFDVVPDVRGAEPLYDIRRAIRDRTDAWRPPAPAPAPERAAPEPEPEPEPVGGHGDSGDAQGGAPVA
jgi:heme/copper-type cytochrome/quinol oxidase subunit 1